MFLGLVAFGRCLEIAIDDWEFVARITRLRAAYAQLVPELAGLLAVAAGDEEGSHAKRPLGSRCRRCSASPGASR